MTTTRSKEQAKSARKRIATGIRITLHGNAEPLALIFAWNANMLTFRSTSAMGLTLIRHLNRYKIENKMFKNYPRNNETGRYIPWKGTEWEQYRKRYLTVDDVRAAYIAGLNDSYGIEMRQSVKAERYIKKMEIIK